MASIVTPIITQAGAAAAAAAYALGNSISVSHVALSGTGYTPTTAATALPDIRQVAAITDGADDGAGSLTITALFRAAAYTGAAYTVKGVGFYIGHPDSGGVLFSVYSAPTWVCARIGEAEADFAASWTLDISTTPAGSVTLTIDPSSGFDAAVMRVHKDAANDHPQYVRNDAAQGLDETAMAQARSNIGAEKASDALRRDGSLAMLAALTLAGNASSPLHAIPKQQLEAYVAAQIAAIPADKYLQGLASYNATTNVLTLAMSDGGHVDVDMSALLADAVGTHEAKSSAHTPAQVGADPAGTAATAVGAHESGYDHVPLATINTLIADAVAAAVTATKAACRDIGEVFFRLAQTPPAGALVPAGQVLLRADYPMLWEHAVTHGLVVNEAAWITGTNYVFFSSGDGATTFRVPRLGGLFPRFADYGAGVDPSRTVGSYQEQKVPAHTHDGVLRKGAPLTRVISNEATSSSSSNLATGDNTSSQTDSWGDGTENRPNNIAFLACMWHGNET